MAIKYLNFAWDQQNLTQCQKLVFLSLCDQADENGKSFPNVNTIAKRAVCDVRSVYNCLKVLKKRGLLRVVNKKGRSSDYYITGLTSESISYPPENISDPTPELNSPITTNTINHHKTNNCTFKKEAIKIIEFLNEVSGKNFRKVETNYKPVIALLKDGFSSNDIKNVIRRKSRSDFKEGEWRKYLRPETLFRKSKFESYFAEIPLEETKDEMS